MAPVEMAAAAVSPGAVKHLAERAAISVFVSIVALIFLLVISHSHASDENEESPENGGDAEKHTARVTVMAFCMVAQTASNLDFSMPATYSEAMFESLGLSVSLSGLWLGVYSAGALVALPLWVWLSRRSICRAFLLYVACMLAGTLTMAVGVRSRSLPLIMAGRGIAGAEVGIRYTNEFLLYMIVPRSDRSYWMGMWYTLTAVSNTTGPAVSSALTNAAAFVGGHMITALTSELVIFAMFVVYGCCFLYCLARYFPMSFDHPEDVDAGDDSDGAPAPLAVKLIFFCVVTSVFLRVFARVGWEAGAISMYDGTFAMGATRAGYAVGAISLSSIVGRAGQAHLASRYGDSLDRAILHWCSLVQLASAAALMPWPAWVFGPGPAATKAWLWMFTAASVLLCNANLVQSVPVKTLASTKLLPDSWLFNKAGLALCSFVGYMLAILSGPSIGRFVLNVGTPQQREWAFPGVLVAACVLIAANTSLNLLALDWTDGHEQPKGFRVPRIRNMPN